MKRETLITLSFFIVLGSILRIWQFWYQCVWIEEQYTLKLASLPVIQIIQQSITSDFNSPLYYLIVKIGVVLQMAPVLSLRIPALIFGILLIPAMYLLGRTYQNELTGVFCSGLTSILYPFVYYSQYGRSYSIAMLGFALLLTAWLVARRGGNSFPFWVGVGLIGWTHLFMLIPAFLLALDILCRNGVSVNNFHQIAIAGLLSSPLLVSMVSVLKDRATSHGINYGYTPFENALMMPGELYGVLFMVIGSLILVSVVAWANREVMTMICVAAITVMMLLLASVFTPVFPRYGFAAAILGIVIASGIVKKGPEYIEGIGGYVDPAGITYGIALCMILLLFAQYSDFVHLWGSQIYTCL